MVAACDPPETQTGVRVAHERRQGRPGRGGLPKRVPRAPWRVGRSGQPSAGGASRYARLVRGQRTVCAI